MFLFLCFCFKNLDLLDRKTTVIFFSQHFICHFHFLGRKIMSKVFPPQTISCSGFFSSFYWFYFWFWVFHVHHQFFVIFTKLLVIGVVVEFFIFFIFNSLILFFDFFIWASSSFNLSFSSFICASFSFFIFSLFDWAM